MKIAVCLKQVPDMESKFKIIDEKIVDESQMAFKINDFDNYAVEAALKLKERFGGEVVIVTAGPDRAVKDIRQAFAMGADRGVHINDPAVESGDNFVVASTLVKAIEDIGDVDLVLTGVQAEDDQAGVTCSMIAHLMGFPHCTNVVKLEVADDKKSLRVNRELEGGLNEVIELSVPAVLSIQSGLNEPRYPTLPGIMKAKKKPLDGKTASDLGVKTESQTEFMKIFFPVTDHRAEIIEGDPVDAAGALLEKLKNEVRVI